MTVRTACTHGHQTTRSNQQGACSIPLLLLLLHLSMPMQSAPYVCNRTAPQLFQSQLYNQHRQQSSIRAVHRHYTCYGNNRHWPPTQLTPLLRASTPTHTDNCHNHEHAVRANHSLSSCQQASCACQNCRSSGVPCVQPHTRTHPAPRAWCICVITYKQQCCPTRYQANLRLQQPASQQACEGVRVQVFCNASHSLTQGGSTRKPLHMPKAMWRTGNTGVRHGRVWHLGMFRPKPPTFKELSWSTTWVCSYCIICWQNQHAIISRRSPAYIR